MDFYVDEDGNVEQVGAVSVSQSLANKGKAVAVVKNAPSATAARAVAMTALQSRPSVTMVPAGSPARGGGTCCPGEDGVDEFGEIPPITLGPLVFLPAGALVQNLVGVYAGQRQAYTRRMVLAANGTAAAEQILAQNARAGLALAGIEPLFSAATGAHVSAFATDAGGARRNVAKRALWPGLSVVVPITIDAAPAAGQSVIVTGWVELTDR